MTLDHLATLKCFQLSLIQMNPAVIKEEKYIKKKYRSSFACVSFSLRSSNTVLNANIQVTESMWHFDKFMYLFGHLNYRISFKCSGFAN